MRAASALFAIAAGPLFGADVYFNDFNGPVGTTFPEWTSSGYIYSGNKAGTVAPGSGPQAVGTVASPNGKQRFLGEFGGPAIITAPPYDPQHFVRVDETVTLKVNEFPPHTFATVSFDLYVLKSWDGNNPNYGPDQWSLSVRGGDRLLNATFSNNLKTGAYELSQQNYPIANSNYQTGAATVNTLGYTFYGESIYHLTFTFAHTGGTLMLDFSSSLFEGKGTEDESWGLDNVRVSINADGPMARSAAGTGDPRQPDRVFDRVTAWKTLLLPARDVWRRKYFRQVSASQNAAPGCPADLKPPGDFGLGDAGTVESPDLHSVQSNSHRPPQTFAVPPSLSQSRTGSLAQDLPFKLRKDRQQPRHGTTGGVARRRFLRHRGRAAPGAFLDRSVLPPRPARAGVRQR